MTTRESAEKKFVSSTESPLAVDKMSQKLLVRKPQAFGNTASLSRVLTTFCTPKGSSANGKAEWKNCAVVPML